MNYNNLSPGEKLNLKGKLFELSKKLHEIDSNTNEKLNSDTNFKPQITSYYLPDREENFIDNVKRAEALKKQKLKLLQLTLEHQQSKVLTFSPQINRKGEKPNKPVHERLYEKAVESRSKHEDRIRLSKSYDFDGNKLFSPEVKTNKFKDLPSNMSADEFLYRDAMDREERHRQRAKEHISSLDNQMNSTKINPLSQKILKKKAEREVRQVFDYINQENDGIISLHELQNVITILVQNGKISSENKFKLSERIWSILDRQKIGEVNIEKFMEVFYPCAYRLAITMAWTDSITQSSSLSSSLSWDPKDNVYILKSFFKDLLELVQLNNKMNSEMITTTIYVPKINKKSHILAKKKEQEDIQKLNETKNINNINDISNTDLMHARHLLIKNNLNLLRNKIKENELIECSFQPNITNKAKEIYKNKNRNRTLSNNSIEQSIEEINDNESINELEKSLINETNNTDKIKNINEKESVHNRLYSYRNKTKSTKDIGQIISNELESCTFSPTIPKRITNPDIQKPGAVPLAKNYEKNVIRIKKAREMKLKELEEIEKNKYISDERYQKNRLLLSDGPKPFHFLTDERIKEKKEKGKGPPKLYVDVKLGLARIGHIKIRDNDDPDELARNFCRVYGLDEIAINVLANAAKESMITHNISRGRSNINLNENESSYSSDISESNYDSTSELYSDDDQSQSQDVIN